MENKICANMKREFFVLRMLRPKSTNSFFSAPLASEYIPKLNSNIPKLNSKIKNYRKISTQHFYFSNVFKPAF
jgi:hypothetical protein